MLTGGCGSIPELQRYTWWAAVSRHVRVGSEVPGAGRAARGSVCRRHKLQDNSGAGRQPDTQHSTVLVEWDIGISTYLLLILPNNPDYDTRMYFHCLATCIPMFSLAERFLAQQRVISLQRSLSHLSANFQVVELDRTKCFPS